MPNSLVVAAVVVAYYSSFKRIMEFFLNHFGVVFGSKNWCLFVVYFWLFFVLGC